MKASAMQWLRLYHGTASDPKFTVVARKAGQPRVVVLGLWLAMLECASTSDDRGSLAGFDFEDAAALLDLDPETVSAIWKAMQDKGLHDGERISSWDKRQPKREDPSSERTREYRERKVTQCDAPVTQGDAVVTPQADTVTLGDARGEEIRLEKKDGGSREPPTRVRKRPTLDPACQAHFEEWWKHYPHRVAKPAAEKAFAVAITKAPLAELILGAQRYAVTLAQPNAPSPKYPQGWLNDERWNDQIPTREPQNGHASPHHDPGQDALRAGLAAAAASRLGPAEPGDAPGDPRDRAASFG